MQMHYSTIELPILFVSGYVIHIFINQYLYRVVKSNTP
jgi:hypothetical protein